MLMRNVNYEIPALKKQITKCQQIQKVGIYKNNGSVTSSLMSCRAKFQKGQGANYKKCISIRVVYVQILLPGQIKNPLLIQKSTSISPI